MLLYYSLYSTLSCIKVVVKDMRMSSKITYREMIITIWTDYVEE